MNTSCFTHACFAVFKRLKLVLVLLVVSGCSQVSIDDYAGQRPSLDIKEFFNGQLLVYGMLQDRSGMVTRRFSATIAASWDGEVGTLDEHFIYDDGTEEDRIWRLTHQGDGRYIGTAGDVVGEANGQIRGSVFQWQYKLDVPYNDGTIVVKLDDWLYLLDDAHLINRTRLTKFGFTVGELTLFIEKLAP